MGLTQRELAERSGCSPDTVRRFVELGVRLVLVSGEPYERDGVEGVELRQLGP